MEIRFTESFQNRFLNQVVYIAKDSPSRARKFHKELLSAIKKISKNPYIYRKSIYFDDDSIRDLIFKGYTVVFIVEQNVITIFGFIKYQSTIKD